MGRAACLSIPKQRCLLSLVVAAALLLLVVQWIGLEYRDLLGAPGRAKGTSLMNSLLLEFHRGLFGDSHPGSASRIREQLVCALKGVVLRVRRAGRRSEAASGGRPSRGGVPLGLGPFNSCAVVTGSSAMRGALNGAFIDSHDAVLRFGDHPVADHESDVGSKTTFRLVNALLPGFRRKWSREGTAYGNASLLVFALPTDRNDLSQDSWSLRRCLEAYRTLERDFPDAALHFLDPLFAWKIESLFREEEELGSLAPGWRFLPIEFYGVLILMHLCEWVRAFEFVPSVRSATGCNYWTANSWAGGKFGCFRKSSQNFLGLEQLLVLLLDEGSERNVFLDGFVTVLGLRATKCWPVPPPVGVSAARGRDE